MPQLRFISRHQLSSDEATARIKERIAEEVKKQAAYVTDLKETWTDPNHADFSFKAYGYAVSGSFQSEEGEVHAELTLPFAATMIQGMIENQVKTILGQILS